MNKILIVFLLSLSNISYAGMDRQGNPTLDPEAPPQVAQSVVDSDRHSAGIALLNEVLGLINRHYYKNIDFNNCIPALLKDGVSGCTDRYSYYLDPVQTKEEHTDFLSGEVAGIGVTIELNKEGGLKVLSVIEGSPAEKVGILENDVVIAVSSSTAISEEAWVDVRKMPLDQSINLIRGPKGSSVNLMVIRNGEQKILTMTRDVVKVKFLKSKMIGPDTGYIKINAFGGEVARQFYETMVNLDKSGAKAVIIDLRNNGGGKLNSVVDMCSWFAPKRTLTATVLYVVERNSPAKDLTTVGMSIGKFNKKKVVVLQNGNSASASEIFSGYLKHEAGAVVIGETSFGKGIVQSLIALSNGGELHLTISEYFIGSRMVKVHGIGITPTIEVKQEKIPKNEKEDLQLQRAIEEAQKLLK